MAEGVMRLGRFDFDWTGWKGIGLSRWRYIVPGWTLWGGWFVISYYARPASGGAGKGDGT